MTIWSRSVEIHGPPGLALRGQPGHLTMRRVGEHLAGGDPWASMDAVHHALDPLLELWESLPGGELNFPPDYPKMPGEPPRVQPSKKVAGNWDEDGRRVED